MYPGIAPPIKTNEALRNKLALNTIRRPIISADIPHTAAPTRNPTWLAIGIPAICRIGIPYSFVTAGFAIEEHAIRSYRISISMEHIFWSLATY